MIAQSGETDVSPAMRCLARSVITALLLIAVLRVALVVVFIHTTLLTLLRIILTLLALTFLGIKLALARILGRVLIGIRHVAYLLS